MRFLPLQWRSWQGGWTVKPGGTRGSHVCSWRSVAIRFEVETLLAEACAVWIFCLLAPKVHSSHWCQHHRWDEGRLRWGLLEETRRNRSPTSSVRPQWVNHPPRRSQSPSTAPVGARGDCPAACLVGHQSDMVSLGLVQGCFKMYWGLLRVGFRVGLRFPPAPRGRRASRTWPPSKVKGVDPMRFVWASTPWASAWLSAEMPAAGDRYR